MGGGPCTRTLGCPKHGLEAKKAVPGRRITDEAWERIQDPAGSLKHFKARRIAEAGKEERNNRKAENASKESATPKGSCSKSDISSPPESRAAHTEACWSGPQLRRDPVGLLLAYMVYLLVIASAFALWGLNETFAARKSWAMMCLPVFSPSQQGSTASRPELWTMNNISSCVVLPHVKGRVPGGGERLQG
ncbi:MAG: hypothetical protein L6R39_002185 [Caloplaca ligustica]|nr:MAG: hypothetical protein L6R39_002185 [Caloplaca ligustica]